MSIPAILILAEQGNSFSLKVHGEEFRNVTQSDRIHHYLWNATECKTHETVLQFLKGLKGNENFKPFHMNSFNCIHDSNSELVTDEGISHYCPVERMIYLVEMSIARTKKAKL